MRRNATVWRIATHRGPRLPPVEGGSPRGRDWSIARKFIYSDVQPRGFDVVCVDSGEIARAMGVEYGVMIGDTSPDARHSTTRAIVMMTSSVPSAATLRARSSAAMRGGGRRGGAGARVARRPGGGGRRAGGDGAGGGRRARRRMTMRGAPRALFTGLVQGKARVEAFETLDGEFARLTLGFPSGTLDGIRIGASVAVNGTCLTVTRVDGVDACVGSSASKTASFDLIVETLRATNLGKLQVGGEVNYERSARVGDEIGGHTVSGHVHCTAAITAVEDTEHNRKVVFKLSDVGLIKYVLPKGFISVDGCSLTVGEVNKATGEFNVWLIPETLRVTVLGNKSVGDDVNLEIESQTQVIVDTIERYMAERGM